MPNLTRTFTRDELEAIGVPDKWTATWQRAEHLHEEQVDMCSWVSVHQLVFRAPDDGKTYSVCYERGLTEYQDGVDPWDDDDEVTATAVEERQVTVTQWLPVETTEVAS